MCRAGVNSAAFWCTVAHGPFRIDRPFARRRRARATRPRAELAQDYVELIAELIERTGEARAIDVARRLGVSHVTVNRAVQRLRKGGLVTTEPYR